MPSYSRKDLKRMRKLAVRAGWRVDQARNGHWRFFPPDGVTPPCVTGSTPSDSRSWANFVGCLRRKGLDV